MEAGGPFALSIEGHGRVVLENIMVGEVWLCGGQSNMDLPLAFFHNHDDTATAANLPGLRFYDVKKPGGWRQCDPNSVKDFSATGFFFGREMHAKLGVPAEGDGSWSSTMPATFSAKTGFSTDCAPCFSTR